VLGRSVICIVGNGLDDVHDLLRQPVGGDNYLGRSLTIVLAGGEELEAA
jgi:hypothetical protein